MKPQNLSLLSLSKPVKICPNCGRSHLSKSGTINLSADVSAAVRSVAGSVKRRQFLTGIAAASTVGMLSNCSPSPDPESGENLSAKKLEKNRLKIAFLPITCATPILISQSLGLYQKYGLDVELVRMNSWNQVQESAIVGNLDAYHMLSPMPIAISLGLQGRPFPIKLACIENINGNAITVANKHRDNVKGPADFKGFRIAIPFIYSMHNLLLRYYLAAGKVNPDRDVELVVLPPPDMVNKLGTGEIDAMIVAEPFNQLAVARGVGFIHLLTRELWPGHPCCSFATSRDWIDRYPNTFRALNKVIIEGSSYARLAQNRRDVARRLSESKYLNVGDDILQDIMIGNFVDGAGQTQEVPDRIDFDPYPWKSFSYWITSQFERWGYLPLGQTNHEAIADDIFMTGLARQMAKQLGHQPPTIILRYEDLKFDRFDPSEPENYALQQIEKYGF
ncbi:MAG: ABC transporter substrate-binding protein [Limnospira sp.]